MAVISKVMIGNMALSLIGARSEIEAFNEKSAEANQIQLWYDFSRLQALAAHDWGFARRREALVDDSEDPPDGVWAYRYAYPTKCVTARKIENAVAPPNDAIPFDIEVDATGARKTILTDVDDAILVYTYDSEDPINFSPFFVELLSYILASHIGFSLTGKRAVVKDMIEMYGAMLQQAPAIDANESMKRPPRDVDWIRARTRVGSIGSSPSWSAQADADN